MVVCRLMVNERIFQELNYPQSSNEIIIRVLNRDSLNAKKFDNPYQLADSLNASFTELVFKPTGVEQNDQGMWIYRYELWGVRTPSTPTDNTSVPVMPADNPGLEERIAVFLQSLDKEEKSKETN